MKTISFGDANKFDKLRRTNSHISQSSNKKSEKSSTKSSNLWHLSNNELSVKTSDEANAESIGKIQFKSSNKTAEKVKNNVLNK